MTCPMSDMEVHKALWSLGEDKVPEPDGFPLLFFHYYWYIIGGEVLEVMQAIFHSNGIPEEWKKMLISLIPKRFDASVLGHFKSINMCTIFYKLCIRILVGWLQLIVP